MRRSDRAARATRQHEFLFSEGQHRAAYQACKTREIHDAHGQNDGQRRGSERDYHQDREQDRREGHQTILNPHRHCIRPTAAIAGHQTDGYAEQDRQADTGQAHRQLDAGAVNDAAENVAPEFVGAKEMRPRRRFEQITDTDLVRVFWSEHARHQRPQHCDSQDQQADDDLLLPANAPQALP